MAGTAFQQVDHAAFGQRLVALRGKRSQTDVARSIGVTQATWCNYEQGRLPRIDIALRIAGEFGVSLGELVGEGCAMTADPKDELSEPEEA